MDDLISRQAAIDAFYIQADDDGWWTGTVQDMEEFLKGLPSVQEQQWIPVTERLPEKGIDVLITSWENVVMIAWIEDGEWTTDAFAFGDQSDVLAWMPLPEPYKGEK